MTTKFSTELPVRPDDIDQFQHVHNSRYLDYIQAARYDQMVHHYKMSMKEFMNRGFGFVVKKATLNFKRALIMGDVIIVHTQVRDINLTDITVDVEIIHKKKNKLVLDAEMVYTMIKLESGWSEKIPDDIREKYLV